ncbi:hypothetical protein [uncultured Chitinophaga sp.]|jgi:hypothetical protein|uniref:hypothetical protein n=1 Tax=uncultured Chitinophaga sp. TaxID=339340 RepID=UPI002606A719|nr:hypothetical protein [uncultured Chitinophaga sp.]
MSKNSKEYVKNNIQELAIGNYLSYPEDYSPARQETEVNIQSLAKGYWDVRDVKEIQRDEKLGINLEDYISWTKEAFRAFVQQHADSLN